jgi:hypothetical protein
MPNAAASARLRGLLATTVALVALAWLPFAGPASSQAVLSKPAVPTNGAYLGASASVHNGETRAQAIERTESQIGRGLDIDHQFYRWDQSMVTSTQQADAAAGRIPFVSWKPMTAAGAVITWTSIVAGNHDSHIRSVARTMRDFGHPMFAVFNHEPYNESLEGWGTAADYRAAYRHIVELFRDEGATNVAWVLVLTGWDYTENRGPAFYPGPDVIDWIAADPYNYYLRDGTWSSLERVASAFYAWGSTTGKPLMLAEWGSTEDPAVPGRKAAWFDEASARLRAWPNIKAVAYFNNLHTYDWRIDTSTTSLDAFRRMANDPWFQPSFAAAAPTTSTTTSSTSSTTATTAAPTTPTTAAPTTTTVAPTTSTTAPTPPPASAVTFVGSAASMANARTHRVVVPSAARAGDGVVLVASTNSSSSSLSAPSGGGTWRELGTVSDNSMLTRAWRLEAGTTTQGATITLTTPSYVKVHLTVLVYRGTGSEPVASFVAAPAPATSTRSHTTPTTNVARAGSWVVSYWAQEDSSSTTPFTAPAGVATRVNDLGSGGGRLSVLVADQGDVAAGAAGGLTATSGTASRHASRLTIVVQPR